MLIGRGVKKVSSRYYIKLLKLNYCRLLFVFAIAIISQSDERERVCYVSV